MLTNSLLIKKETLGWDIIKYCFLKPISPTDSYIFKPFCREPLIGEVVIINETLKKQGVQKGDIVSFKPFQEYEFNVDGEVLYQNV